MEAMLTKTIAKTINGQLIGLTGHEKITTISIDTRVLQPGALFVALSGSRTHGERFINQAVQQGAVASLTDKAIKDNNIIKVKNTRQALGQLATGYREKFPRLKVIGITGSSGKTTVKEMVTKIIQSRQSVLMSQGNFNNDLGLPLSLFNLNKTHRVAVLEMGMNAPGEIRNLAKMAKPVIGVITNIGDAHLGQFKSKRALANAKLELIQSLPSTGICVLNEDDPYLRPWIKKKKAISFGLSRTAQVRILKTGVNFSGTQVDLGYKQQQVKIKLKTFGVHHAWNAATAVATALAAGMPFNHACQTLNGYRPVAKMRTDIKKLGTHYLINDAYNSNPQSAAAAINLLAELPVQGKKIVILGDMLELGEASITAHKELGQLIAVANIDCLIGAGKFVKHSVKAAKSSGLADSHFFNNLTDVGQFIKTLKGSHHLFLLKGSRGMTLERLVPEIKKLSMKGR